MKRSGLWQMWMQVLGAITLVGVGMVLVGCQPAATPPAKTATGGTASAPVTEKEAKEKPAEEKAAAPAEEASVVLKPQLLSEEELREGWISLFDGQTLFGWHAHSKADWQVKDDAITVTGGEPGLLCTPVRFADYVLKVDVQTDATSNSGIFLRTPPVVGKEDVTTRCYELNMAPSDNPFPTGSLVGRKKVEKPIDLTQWTTIEARCEGNHITVTIGGEVVCDYTDEKPTLSGLVGLQLNSGRASFKNVRLLPLSQKSIFPGENLSGWKQPEGSKSRFSLTPEGELLVEDGRGCLETEGEYQDFCVQLECKTLAADLNGGLFLRCIPGELMNGYESQIHNGLVDGDRTKPKDCGTGGVFRRVNARYVVSDDLAWFTKTIVVDGDRIATWVNGYCVTDWQDTRELNDNPRNGLRKKAGTLQIQGHDPTTKILFRKMSVATLPGE